jgi:hypothetical protein
MTAQAHSKINTTCKKTWIKWIQFKAVLKAQNSLELNPFNAKENFRKTSKENFTICMAKRC